MIHRPITSAGMSTAALLLAFTLAGCASAVPGYSPTARDLPKESLGEVVADGRYVMSKEEQALDCKKLTGRMQIRILQVRDQNDRSRGSAVAQTAQAVVSPVFKGSAYGVDPDAQLARDVAVLRAYNDHLSARGCPTFDLDAELKPKPADHSPRPRAKS